MHIDKIIKGFFLLFTLIISSFCYPALTYSRNASSYSLMNLTETVHEGNLLVSNNETLLIENTKYHLIGDLIIKDTAKVIIKNSIFNQTSSTRINIFVFNNSRLVIENSKFIAESENPAKIFVSGNSVVEITNSTLVNSKCRIWIWTYNKAHVYMDSSIIESPEDSEIITDDESKAYVKNSSLGRLVLWGNSFISAQYVTLLNTEFSGVAIFNNSTFEAVHLETNYIRADEGHKVTIRNSKINSWIRAGDNVELWFTRSSAPELSAGGEAKVWLIDSSVGHIEEYGNATVLVGWEVPVLGVIAFHYTIAGIARILLIAIGVTAVLLIIVVTYILWKRRKRRELKRRKKI